MAVAGVLGCASGWVLGAGGADRLAAPAIEAASDSKRPGVELLAAATLPSTAAPQALFRHRAMEDDLPAPVARLVERLDDLAHEYRSVLGAQLPPALEKAGLLIGLGSYAPEANSLYESLTYQIIEAVALASPGDFPGLAKLIAGRHSLQDLSQFARETGLEKLFTIPDHSGSAIGTIESFLAAIADLRGVVGYRPIVGGDLHALGPGFARESFREALADPAIGQDVQAALVHCAREAFPLLTINRLLHLLQSQDFLFKVRELREMPWDSFVSPTRTAYVGGSDLELALGRAESLGDGPAPIVAELGRRLSRRDVVIRELSRKDMEDFNRRRMGDGVRVDNIRAARLLSQVEGEPHRILLIEGSDAEDSLHEFVHILQAEREGAAWVNLFLMESEMEAHAVEIETRRRKGNHRLYRQIAALSPYGFAMGLRHYVEQLYFRLADVPSVVS